MKKLISLLCVFVLIFSFAGCTTLVPVADYEEPTENGNVLDIPTTEEKEEVDYTKGWDEAVRNYISVYLGEGDYVKTVNTDTATGMVYTICYNEVPRFDAISYGREVGIWEDDWVKKKDNSLSVTDMHTAFSITLTHRPKPVNGYNFTISVKIYSRAPISTTGVAQ